VSSTPASGGKAAAASSSGKKRSLRRYLVAGILVWLPILATFWVVTFIIRIMDWTLVLLPPAYRPQALLGFALPGFGAVVAFAIVLATGLLVTNLIGHQLMVYGEEMLNRIPFVRSVYSSVKSFTESVFSQSSSFRKVVMIEYPRSGAWSIGFLTAENVPEITEKTGEPHSCVYLSNALNPTAGFLVIVPRAEVVELEMSVDSAMKMIITCGVDVPQPQPEPVAGVASAP
jgi:uncharacterized membrane protein